MLLQLLLISGVIFNRSSGEVYSDDFSINCFPDSYQITLPLSASIQNQITQFSLLKNLCRPVLNGTHLVLNSMYNECGTIKQETEEGYEFTNDLILIRDTSKGKQKCLHTYMKVSCLKPYFHHRRRRGTGNDIINGHIKEVRCRRISGTGQYRGSLVAKMVTGQVSIRTRPKIITCPLLVGVGEALSSNRILTSSRVMYRSGVRIKQKSNQNPLCRRIIRQGLFHTILRTYTDATFNTEVNKWNMKSINWFDDVFYEISMLPKHENLRVIPIDCYATPFSNPNDKLKYSFLINGCPLDPTIKFYRSEGGSFRFSITGFRFHKSNSLTFFTHCKLLICDENDTSSRCQKRCQKSRRKRDTKEEILLETKKSRSSLLQVIYSLYSEIPQLRLTSYRHKTKRYLFLKSFKDASIAVKVYAPKYTSYSPVQVNAIEKDDVIVINNILSNKNVKFSIKKCLIGQSRIKARQKLILKNGCPTEYGKDILRFISGNLIIKKSFTNPRKKLYVNCFMHVCDSTDKYHCVSSCATARNRRDSTKEVKLDSVSCGSNIMTITLQKSMLIARHKLSLIDQRCTPEVNSTHLIFKTNLSGCSTRQTSENGVLKYKNEIRSVIDTKLPITRKNVIKIPVSCSYKIKPLVKPVKINIGRQSLKAEVVGRYAVDINMYTDSNFTRKLSDGLVEVEDQEDLFFDVSISNQEFGKQLALHLDVCLGYPLYRTDSREIYQFIEDGCALDNTVVFYKTTELKRKRFSIKAFQFEGNHSSIAISCYVTACDATDKNSKCRKDCKEK